MRILVLNSGSSSLKFQVIETSPEQADRWEDRLLAKGRVERIGSAGSMVVCQATGAEEVRYSEDVPDHRQAIAEALTWLKKSGVAAGASEIDGVGHRIVHGGEFFYESVRMDDGVVRQIEACIELAPLHNPHNLKGYHAVRDLAPGMPQVAVFDTAFHHQMPARARLYAIPYVHYTRDHIRRYGFHGSSHRYVSRRFARIDGRSIGELKLISCHLGNGCSICAIDRGRSVDTTMGFTPLEGLVMGTRSGDIDPGAVLHLGGKNGMSLRDLDVLLNQNSGLLGVSGISNDMRELLAESDKGNERARLAVELFCYRAKKYVGAYLAALGGADAVIFTGGIGENAPRVRGEIGSGLEPLGIRLDAARNDRALGTEAQVSTDDSGVKLWVVPTNEEVVIARDTMRAIQGIPVSGA